jgi:hypothetical protein
MSDSDESKPKASFKEIMQKAGASAVRGGTAGAVAMGANVACLMVREQSIIVLLVLSITQQHLT